MNKFFVTTSRGWVADTTTSSQEAYALCRKLREETGLDYKVIRPTPYRLILGNPVALSIPADANIIIEGGIAYSFVKESYYEVHIADKTNKWTCPYTKVKGTFDETWLAEWQG